MRRLAQRQMRLRQRLLRLRLWLRLWLRLRLRAWGPGGGGELQEEWQQGLEFRVEEPVDILVVGQGSCGSRQKESLIVSVAKKEPSGGKGQAADLAHEVGA